MADAAFTQAPFAAYTTAELLVLSDRAKADGDAVSQIMTKEIERRKAAALGDVSIMTPCERLRYAKSA